MAFSLFPNVSRQCRGGFGSHGCCGSQGRGCGCGHGNKDVK